MRRPAGYLVLVLAVGSGVAAWAVDRFATDFVAEPTAAAGSKALSALAVILAGYGLYLLLRAALNARTADSQRRQVARNLLRLVFTVATAIGVFAVVTEQWVGLLFSLGVIGFGATFALQQPLFSLIGWLYIAIKEPYKVGDRVAIEDSKGDVVDVDLFVTTLWEIEGDLVSSHQPSGRTTTVPNSVVLSSHVKNYTTDSFPYVWNELKIQVAYETDLPFVRELVAEVADDHIGDEMAERIAAYRDLQAETPVDTEVADRPTVNVRTVPEDAWVELRVRYLVDPKRSQQVRNTLFERILEALNDESDRVQFPVGRSR